MGSLGGNNCLSLERLLEVAHATGELVLTCRNLKTFPKHRCKYDLKDTVTVDLSRNKLSELPPECTDYFSLEKLVLYHNTIRTIPDSVVYLQSLRFLDLSRNQLSYLPTAICELPLQALVVNNNRLVSLPEEIGKMSTLMELDASCNEITHLPVQIGDLSALKVLDLRRNHLQEIPIEISYLQLSTLDLSGNRITTLPVELRFMTTVVSLNLGENPLTYPPANLVSRGKIHVFKYLEIQAIKEDRKRGVLTDGDYRRSYRKTTAQLNDFRFASGFGADARRKRHTADSGYGSEQPLDRRWSQEFNQEADHHHPSNADDTRRIMMRAANCQRSPRAVPTAPTASTSTAANSTNPISSQTGGGLPLPASMEAVIRNRMTSSSAVNSSTGAPLTNAGAPMTSAGSTTSSTGSSSGYSSINNETSHSQSGGSNNNNIDYACHLPQPMNNSRAVPIPSVSSSSTESSSGNCRIIPIIKEKPMVPQPQGNQSSNIQNNIHQNGVKPNENESVDGRNITVSNNGDCSEDYEKEERRRAAQRVLGKQGPAPPTPPTKLLKSQLPSPSASYKQAMQRNSSHSKPNSMLPLPNAPNTHPTVQPALPHRQFSMQTTDANTGGGSTSFRQFKDRDQQQLRLQQHQQLQQRISGHHRNNESDVIDQPQNGGGHYQQPRLTASALARMQQLQGAEPTLPSTTTRSLYDVKAMQKEAVLSYVKSKQGSPAKSVAGRGSQPDLPTTKNGSSLSNGGRASSTTSIPQPSPTGVTSIKSLGKLKMEAANARNSSSTSRGRHDVEKSATADAHINQLRLEIESRLRITLPEDISPALADGVILCHVANHVRPRAVPSIHVPSPSVPKLNTAKCRRNVENFLLACRKIGVREDLICSPSDILEPRKQGSVRVAISVSELLRFHHHRT